MNWCYKDGDREIGPVADEAMKALIEAGVVNASFLVKQDGTTEWVSLSESGLSGIKPRLVCCPLPPDKKLASLFKRIAILSFIGIVFSIALLITAKGIVTGFIELRSRGYLDDPKFGDSPNGEIDYYSQLALPGLWGDFSLSRERVEIQSAEVEKDIRLEAIPVSVAA